jgi:hypothetical protein
MSSPYIDPPTIPEGLTVSEYRINRPQVRSSGGFRRLLNLVGAR